MKTKIYPFISILLLVCSILNSQTNFSGGIYTDTNWPLANSPYIITGNVVIFPGKTLSIDPGVQVRFNSNYNIEVRGALIAKGTQADSIFFLADNSTSKGSWDKISILNASQNAFAFFEYCSIKHSTNGIKVECCYGKDSSYVKNCLFNTNVFGLSDYSSWQLPVTNCVFSNNTTAAAQADKYFRNCTFTDNGKGIACERFNAINCTFKNNGAAIFFMNSGSVMSLIDSCSITNNTVGISITGGTITNCDISNNGTGIITAHPSSTEFGIQYYVPIRNNFICNNTTYNVQNYNNYNKNIGQNCFCLTDSASIEGKLLDGYDDITKGLFNYDIYDSACNQITRSIYKIGTPNVTTAVNTLQKSGPFWSVTPNPFNNSFKIKIETEASSSYQLNLYNSLGQLVKQIEVLNNLSSINTESLQSGMYFLELAKVSTSIEFKKIIKE